MTEESLYPNYKVCQIDNFKYYKSFGCLVSEMGKYVGTHLVIGGGMVFYYVFTAPYTTPGWVVPTAILHLIVVLLLILLGYKDPGILPKVLPSYESP